MRGPRVFLTDFGLAKASTGRSDGLSRTTRTGETLGTPAYMSPEQARGETGALTCATDTWALGCVLYELLTARRAFAGDTPAAEIGAVLTSRPTPPLGVPAPVRRVLDVCLQRRAGLRYPNARALHADLVRLASGQAPAARPPRSRRPLVVAGAVALCAAGVWWAASRATVPAASTPARSPHAVAADQAWQLIGADPARAESALDAVVAADPETGEWRVRRGIVRWARGNPTGAYADWRVVAADDPAALRAQLYLGLERVFRPQDGRPVLNAAVPFLQRAATGPPETARLARAALALITGQAAKAAALLRDDPRWEAAYLRALLGQRLQQPAPAIIAEYDRGIALGVGLPFAHFNRGYFHDRLSHWREAVQDFDVAVRLQPGRRNPLVYRARARRRLGDRDGALADYDAAIAIGPVLFGMLHNRGSLRLERGDLDGALEDYAAALRMRPGAVSTLDARAGIYIRRRQWPAALADLNAAVQQDPRHFKSLSDRATVNQALGRPDAADADYTAALAAAPAAERGLIWANRGKLRLMRRQPRRALDDLNQAIAADGDRTDWYSVRAQAYRDLGDAAKALADYERVLAVEPNNVPARSGRGRLRELAGDRAGALEDVSVAVAHAPDRAAYRIQRALLALKLQDLDLAQTDTDAVLARDPDQPDALAVRGLVDAMRGDRGAGIARMQRALRLAPANWSMRRAVTDTLRRLGAAPPDDDR